VREERRAAVIYRLAWSVIGLLIAGAAITGLGRLAGYQLLSVQSNSMKPAISSGDVVVIRARPATVRSGMIVGYHNQTNPRVINTHRIVAINYKTHTMTTKGDNVETPESGIPLSNITGSYAFRIPYLGKVLDLLKHPLGLLVAVYLPVLGIILEEARRLSRYYGTYYPRRYALYR